jgi:NADH-quinone oxidoreductase subunit G
MMLDVLEWDARRRRLRPARKPKLVPCVSAGRCAPGMEVKSSTSEHVARARSAVQELLLLNHPVDCPICDQAGECRLQDYWLEHQRTGKRMHQEIVHKPKGVVFGPTIVYDAERCIVCTRCVRFCEEVAKDPVLERARARQPERDHRLPGPRARPRLHAHDRARVPGGRAHVAIDFRFKARVWFLRSAQHGVPGVRDGLQRLPRLRSAQQHPYRHRPRENEQVNKYWMCDEGMLSYKRAHEDRLAGAALVGGRRRVGDRRRARRRQESSSRVCTTKRAERVAVVLSAQHSNEDNFAARDARARRSSARATSS